MSNAFIVLRNASNRQQARRLVDQAPVGTRIVFKGARRSLPQNDKGDNPNRPDYRGDCTLPDGTTAKLSAWLKEGKKGKFLSLKIEATDEGADFRSSGSGGVAGGRAAESAFDTFVDDVPF